MKIGMTISKVEPSDNGVYVGGSVNALLSLCKGLILRGLAVEVVTCMPATKRRHFDRNILVPVSFSVLNNNAKPQSIGYSLIYLSKMVFWSIIRGRGRVDLMHGHSGYAGYAWVTYLMGIILRCPKIHTIYCPLNSSSNKSQNGISKVTSIVSVVTKYPLGRLDRIVAMSENVFDSLLNAGVDMDKITIIPNGIDTERYTPDLSASINVRKKLKLIEDDKVVLFVGNLLHAKGLDLLIESMVEITANEPHCKLIVTLELEHKGFREKWRQIEKRVAELSLKKNIVRLGMINYMPQLLASADIVVAPYRNTNGPSDYPLAIMEAMSCGTSVVGTKVGGMPELITDGENGYLVDANDVNCLSMAVNKLLKYPELRKKMGAAARTRILNQYSVDRVSKEHMNLYNDVLKVSTINPATL